MPFEREMFTATCGDCGNECKVPFKPKDTRPVYCKECFMKRKPAESKDWKK
jgi:CxxC-x17-CxxC domain-containing protein